MRLAKKIRNVLRMLVQTYGSKKMKSSLWNSEFAGGRWDCLDQTAGDCVYPYLEKFARQGSILDLGCGSGSMANEISAAAYADYTGVDISQVAIDKAKTRTQQNGRANMNRYFQSDIFSYVPSQRFDVIAFRDSIYYVPWAKIRAMLDRYAAHLTRDGVFIVKMCDGNTRYKAIMDTIENHFKVVEKYVAEPSATAVLVFQPAASEAGNGSRGELASIPCKATVCGAEAKTKVPVTMRLLSSAECTFVSRWLIHPLGKLVMRIHQMLPPGMKCKWSFLSVLLLPLLPAVAGAQLWSGIIDPSRAVDWSHAGATITNRTQTCSTPTLSAGSGSTIAGNNGKSITAAIAACPSGLVVMLPAGTWYINGIDFAGHNNVTLRGAGPDQTFLIALAGVNCGGMGGNICAWDNVGNWSGGAVASANWTTGYTQGATSITLNGVNGGSRLPLQVGTLLVLDQLDDATDNGTVYECQTQNICGNDIPGGAGRAGRGEEQLVQVTSVSGSGTGPFTVGISPGLYMPNWRSSQSPGAWWAGSQPATGMGIENLSLDNTASSADAGIYFFNCYNCWVKNVRSLNGNRNHVWVYQSAHVTIRDSYFYGTQNAASESYGVEQYMASDDLIENNIFQKITAGTLAQSTEGSVQGYNYSVYDYYSVVADWMMGAHWLHAEGTDMMLWEGDEGPGFIADNVHGTHHFGTLFRNQYTGWETGKLQQTIPVDLYTHSRYFNVLGNVLGTPGYHTNYSDCYGSSPCITTSDGKGDVSIYTLGWCGNEATGTRNNDGCASAMVSDSITASTLMRWGNYDTVNKAARWVSSEVPSGLSLYANAVPSGQSLPPSLYQSAKPSWWGTMPWPAAGPDVTGGSDPTGHVYANPAQACYTTTMGGTAAGTGSALSFNANNCYGGNLIAPPTNLKNTVH